MSGIELLERDSTAVFGPPGVWTPRAIEEIPSLQQHPYRTQIIDLLRSAEKDLFVPLLTLVPPASFAQQFEFLALRFAPIRITAAIWFFQGIGPNFLNEYFQATQSFRERFVDNSWGLPKAEIAAAFDQYVETARTLIRLGSHATSVQGHDWIRVIRPITEVDFGLTSLGFAFEREINTVEWVVSETFSRTRRALTEYADAVSVISGQIHEAEQVERVLSNLRDNEGIEQPTDRDLKSTFRRYSR